MQLKQGGKNVFRHDICDRQKARHARVDCGTGDRVLDQMNRAITEMNEVTQQNAMLAEPHPSRRLRRKVSGVL
jgi:hypothetical protein